MILFVVSAGEKPYVCTVQGCGKRFTEYSSLYKHHVVHTHSKPYTCSYCGKTYRQTSTLAMHKRTAHGEGEECTAESEAQMFAQQEKGIARLFGGVMNCWLAGSFITNGDEPLSRSGH